MRLVLAALVRIGYYVVSTGALPIYSPRPAPPYPYTAADEQRED